MGPEPNQFLISIHVLRTERPDEAPWTLLEPGPFSDDESWVDVDDWATLRSLRESYLPPFREILIKRRRHTVRPKLDTGPFEVAAIELLPINPVPSIGLVVTHLRIDVDNERELRTLQGDVGDWVGRWIDAIAGSGVFTADPQPCGQLLSVGDYQLLPRPQVTYTNPKSHGYAQRSTLVSLANMRADPEDVDRRSGDVFEFRPRLPNMTWNCDSEIIVGRDLAVAVAKSHESHEMFHRTIVIDGLLLPVVQSVAIQELIRSRPRQTEAGINAAERVANDAEYFRDILARAKSGILEVDRIADDFRRIREIDLLDPRVTEIAVSSDAVKQRSSGTLRAFAALFAVPAAISSFLTQAVGLETLPTLLVALLVAVGVVVTPLGRRIIGDVPQALDVGVPEYRDRVLRRLRSWSLGRRLVAAGLVLAGFGAVAIAATQAAPRTILLAVAATVASVSVGVSAIWAVGRKQRSN